MLNINENSKITEAKWHYFQLLSYELFKMTTFEEVNI